MNFNYHKIYEVEIPLWAIIVIGGDLNSVRVIFISNWWKEKLSYGMENKHEI